MDFLSQQPMLYKYAACALGIAFVFLCVLQCFFRKKTQKSPETQEIFVFDEDGGAQTEAGAKQKVRPNAYEEQQKKAAEREKNSLSALFETNAADTAVKRRIDAQKKSDAGETAKINAAPPSELRALSESVIGKVQALAAKGLSDEQIMQNLFGRVRAGAPLEELVPSADAVLLLLRGRATAEQTRPGVSDNMEQKAALSALTRGNPNPAAAFFQNRAKELTRQAKTTRSALDKEDKMFLAGELYRAGAAVFRPFDLNKSWEFLCRARECDPQNPVSEMMAARACHENGQTKKAAEMFKNIARNGADVPDYVQTYADKMISLSNERGRLKTRVPAERSAYGIDNA